MSSAGTSPAKIVSATYIRAAASELSFGRFLGRSPTRSVVTSHRDLNSFRSDSTSSEISSIERLTSATRRSISSFCNGATFETAEVALNDEVMLKRGRGPCEPHQPSNELIAMFHSSFCLSIASSKSATARSTSAFASSTSSFTSSSQVVRISRSAFSSVRPPRCTPARPSSISSSRSWRSALSESWIDCWRALRRACRSRFSSACSSTSSSTSSRKVFSEAPSFAFSRRRRVDSAVSMSFDTPSSSCATSASPSSSAISPSDSRKRSRMRPQSSLPRLRSFLPGVGFSAIEMAAERLRLIIEARGGGGRSAAAANAAANARMRHSRINWCGRMDAEIGWVYLSRSQPTLATTSRAVPRRRLELQPVFNRTNQAPCLPEAIQLHT